MRVTQSMLSSNFLKNLSNSYEKLDKYQEQASSQKKINRPSDDPVVAMKGITYRTALQEVDQYKRNFSEAHNWIDNSDSALDEATKAMQRISELTTEAANGTLEPSERQSIAKEVEQLRDHLATLANTKVGDKYIFNGTSTLTPPVDLSTGTPVVNQNNNPVKMELSQGVLIQVNVASTDPNQQVFNQAFFDNLDGLITNLKSASNNVNFDQNLTDLNTYSEQIVNARSTIGAVSNRVDLMESRIDQQKVSTTKMMSDNEDANMEEVITNLMTQESVQRAALGVGAKIIQPTLLDFLH